MIALPKFLKRRKRVTAEQATDYAEAFMRNINSRYDAAQTTVENESWWMQADYSSPRSSANAEVRSTLRSRSRYEIVENNSFAKGMVLTKIDDCIGTGPKLQVMSDQTDFNARVEEEWCHWSDAINLPHKLRTMLSAKLVDGEAFAELTKNSAIDHEVKLDLRPTEADLWTAPFIKPTEEERYADGIQFDRSGNPIGYHRRKNHPGDDFMTDNPDDFERIDAQFVLHWFRADRPDQKRGIPEMASALPLFSQFRRFRLATISAAEAAAEFAGIIHTDSGVYADLAPKDIAHFKEIPVVRRMLMTMPAGWMMTQMKAEHPTETHHEFSESIMTEIARCLQQPLIIALGNSREANYSSARADWLPYWVANDVVRADCALVLLNKIFREWLAEATTLNNFLPRKALRRKLRKQWVFPARYAIDQEQQAKADEIYFNLGWLTDQSYLAREQIDPEMWAEQTVRMMKHRRKLELPLPGVTNMQTSDSSVSKPKSAGKANGRPTRQAA